jgi:hypothetical protein
MEKIICFTDEEDSDYLRIYNEKYFDFELEFINSLDKLSEAKYYIVSLKLISDIFSDLRNSMREKSKSKFIFLFRRGEFKNYVEDDMIRKEKNAESSLYMYDSALFRIKELILNVKFKFAVPNDIPRKVSIEEITISQENYYNIGKKKEEDGLLLDYAMGRRFGVLLENNYLCVKFFPDDIVISRGEIKTKNGGYYIDEIIIEAEITKKELGYDTDIFTFINQIYKMLKLLK